MSAPSDENGEPCPWCAHATHDEAECGVVTGYDHLNGDHDCGCPGEGEASDPCETNIGATAMTTETPTLTEFLLARIAEDEANLPNFAGVSEDDFVVDSATTRWGERVKAECGAKRRIVTMYVGPAEDREGNMSAIGGYGEAWVDATRFLALPYADHPDYREEWGRATTPNAL